MLLGWVGPESLSITSGTQHAGAVGSGTGESSRYSGTPERKGSLCDQAVSNPLIGYFHLREFLSFLLLFLLLEENGGTGFKGKCLDL